MSSIPAIAAIFAAWYFGFNGFTPWLILLCAAGFAASAALQNLVPVLQAAHYQVKNHEPISRVLISRVVTGFALGVPFMALHYGIGYGLAKLLG